VKFEKIKDLFKIMAKASNQLDDEVQAELEIEDPDPEIAKAILNSVEIKDQDSE